jgi:hypothetical protein
MRIVGHVARMGKIKNPYKILLGRAEGKVPVGEL